MTTFQAKVHGTTHTIDTLIPPIHEQPQKEIWLLYAKAHSEAALAHMENTITYDLQPDIAESYEDWSPVGKVPHEIAAELAVTAEECFKDTAEDRLLQAAFTRLANLVDIRAIQNPKPQEREVKAAEMLGQIVEDQIHIQQMIEGGKLPESVGRFFQQATIIAKSAGEGRNWTSHANQQSMAQRTVC